MPLDQNKHPSDLLRRVFAMRSPAFNLWLIGVWRVRKSQRDEREPGGIPVCEKKQNNGWRQSHAREYPPKEFGVQNAPWSSLPAEIRNEIYQYCMAKEEKKFVDVRHYPSGVPRRSVRGTFLSSTNFLQSYWGFTQTCEDVSS